MIRCLLALAVLAGCSNSLTPSGAGGAGDGAGPGGSGDGGAAPIGDCFAALPFQPLEPIAGPNSTVQITAQVNNAGGLLAYSWTVLFRGAAVADTRTFASGTAIEVPVRTAGVYTVRVQVTGASQPCPEASATINVRAPSANVQTFNLRLVPPSAVQAPVQVQMIPVYGGAASDLGGVVVSTGIAFHAAVTSDGGGVPGYLQFTSGGSPGAVNEAFSDPTGGVDIRLPLQAPHSVMIVPSTSEFVPRRIVDWSPGAPLVVDHGAAVTGTVQGPGGAAIAGATVAISEGDLPGTVAVTAADGGFALRTGSTAASAPPATVEVAPTEGSGLPRLVAAVPLSPALAIGYAPTVTVDLGGTVIRRGGALLPGARVTVVGSIPAAGTLTAATAVTATGEVRITGTANAAGTLPPLRVPAAVLTAVIEAAPGDLTAVPLDTRGGAPATIEATAPRRVTTAILDRSGGALPGAVVDLVPGGDLARAGIAARRVVAGPGGVVEADLPGGGRYELRFVDPLGRSAPLVVAEGAVPDIAASYRLPPTILVTGTVQLNGLHPLGGVAVQVLCVEPCSARARARPLLEVVSDATGRFSLALPDPGTR